MVKVVLVEAAVEGFKESVLNGLSARLDVMKDEDAPMAQVNTSTDSITASSNCQPCLRENHYHTQFTAHGVSRKRPGRV